MERYSNFPITKLAIVQPPSRGFPGIDRYGFAGILSYIKSVVDRHVSIDGEWRELSGWREHRQLPTKGTTVSTLRIFTFIGQTRPEQTRPEEIFNVSIRTQGDEIFVSLGFSPDIEDVGDDVMKDIFKNDSAEAIEGAPFSFRVDNRLNIYEDDEDFFNLPSETYPFEPGNPVPARRHTNPDGSRGGWVALESASVGPNVYLGPDAEVFGNAEVSGRGQIIGRARISGNAEISGGTIAGAEISGGWVSGGTIFKDASVSGGTISGSAQIIGGHISGGHVSGGWISGSAEITGGYITGGQVSGGQVSGGHISGGTITGGTIEGGHILGKARISGGLIEGGTISGDAVINDGAYISGEMVVTSGTHPPQL